MAAPSVTYTFSDGTTIVHSEVNQNFTDLINGVSDGTKDLTINDLTVGAAAVFNGTVTLGNATGDDITITGRIASDIDPKTAASNTLGDATQTWQALYLDNTSTDGGAIYFDGGSTEFIKASADGTDLDLGGFTGFDIKAGCAIKTFGTLTSAKTADYTITDTDGVAHILMTTSTTDRTVTLPTAADNTSRVITVTKVDSASGELTIDGEGAETINGVTTIKIVDQHESVTMQCDGSEWFVTEYKAASITSEVEVQTSNGFGSTNTAIRRFTTTNTNVGNAITYADIPANGATFTINQTGIYAISYSESQGSGAGYNFAPSLNSSELTTPPQNFTNVADRLCLATLFNANVSGNCSWQGKLSDTDVIRAHMENSAASAVPSRVQFTITKLRMAY